MKGWRERAADVFADHGENAANMKFAPGPGTLDLRQSQAYTVKHIRKDLLDPVLDTRPSSVLNTLPMCVLNTQPPCVLNTHIPCVLNALSRTYSIDPEEGFCCHRIEGQWT